VDGLERKTRGEKVGQAKPGRGMKKRIGKNNDPRSGAPNFLEEGVPKRGEVRASYVAKELGLRALCSYPRRRGGEDNKI